MAQVDEDKDNMLGRKTAEKADILFGLYERETRPYDLDIENIDRDAVSWLMVSKAQSRRATSIWKTISESAMA
eukprot:9939103-Karenia_brevis.AAC.1